MSSKLDRAARAVSLLSDVLNWLGGVALVAMLVLVVTDVIGAKLFRWPLPGGIEIIGLLGVVVAAFAIAYTQLIHGHIEVQFLVMRLPRHARKVIGCLIYSLGMLLFALLAWTSYDLGRSFQVKGEVSMTQGIPLYPVAYGTAFCSMAVFLVLLVQCLQAVARAKK